MEMSFGDFNIETTLFYQKEIYTLRGLTNWVPFCLKYFPANSLTCRETVRYHCWPLLFYPRSQTKLTGRF